MPAREWYIQAWADDVAYLSAEAMRRPELKISKDEFPTPFAF